MDALREVAQVAEGAGDCADADGKAIRRPARFRLPVTLGELQLEQRLDQPLLGAVVEVPREALPLAIGRGEEPSPRSLRLDQQCVLHRLGSDGLVRPQLLGDVGKDTIAPALADSRIGAEA